MFYVITRRGNQVENKNANNQNQSGKYKGSSAVLQAENNLKVKYKKCCHVSIKKNYSSHSSECWNDCK